MSDSPEQIRADIERTRRGLGRDVDALADKVTPSKIVHRQTDKAKQALGAVSERVMGTAEGASDAVSGLADQAMEAGDRARAKAEGNPLAVGLIAFGVGMLVASLIPASGKEKEIAEAVKDGAQPLVEGVTEAAQQVAGRLQEPAEEAVGAVRQRVTEAVDHVKTEAEDGANALADRAGSVRTDTDRT